MFTVFYVCDIEFVCADDVTDVRMTTYKTYFIFVSI